MIDSVATWAIAACVATTAAAVQSDDVMKAWYDLKTQEARTVCEARSFAYEPQYRAGATKKCVENTVSRRDQIAASSL